jgi:hypothetical protein
LWTGPEPGDSADEGFEYRRAVEGSEPQVVGTGGFLQGGHAVQGRPQQPGVGTGVVLCSAEDDDLSVDASTLYDALSYPRRYYQFRSAEGAGQRCESGARALFHSRAFDWLGQVLNSTRWVISCPGG